MKTYILHLPDNYVKPPLPGGLAWVAELRKPGLPQITGQLKRDDGECCLGVLCRLQGRITLGAEGSYIDSSGGSWYVLDQTNPAAKFIGLEGIFPLGVHVSVGDIAKAPYTALANLNDFGLTFPQIADIIEAVWDCQ